MRAPLSAMATSTAALLLACATACAADGSAGAEPIRYGALRLACHLANQQVDESSGLVASRTSPGAFWTHNDSGDRPRVFAFNAKGEDLGTYTVAGARNRDWEDIAAFTRDGEHFLLLADTGDNDCQETSVTLYIAPEPKVDLARTRADGTMKVAQTLHFTYDDGPQDCEAVAVDSAARTAYLISKRGKRTVYELRIPDKGDAKGLVAKSIATLSLGMVTGMDISPDGLRAAVVTYLTACEYTRRPGEKWSAAFARKPRSFWLPGRQQGESIAFGPDGRSLYFTSEKLPTPLLELPASPTAATK